MPIDGRITKYNYSLPEWVRENIMMECPYCGAPLFDNSDTGTITYRWCQNMYCPGHMSHKVEALAKHFSMEGFGIKSALSWCRSHRGSIHLDILKDWFSDKPLVSLSTVAKLAFIRGYGETSAVTTLDSYASFEDYFTTAESPDPSLLSNKDYLLKCESYFRILQPMSKLQLIVMGTGAFNGYRNRSDFFDEINAAYGQAVHVIETSGPRKTGVACLIKESNAPDRSKSRIAAERGIPVLTPRQFYDMIRDVCHSNMGGE